MKTIIGVDRVVAKTHDRKIWRLAKMNCKVEDILVVMNSDTSLDNTPRHGSQAAVITTLAEPDILFSKAKINILDATSSRVKRIIRS